MLEKIDLISLYLLSSAFITWILFFGGAKVLADRAITQLLFRGYMSEREVRAWAVIGAVVMVVTPWIA